MSRLPKLATNETVICPLSYETRKQLEQLCALCWTVADGATNAYFGSDLIHRLYHMPAFGENIVEHFKEACANILAIAKNNATYSICDSDVLQYSALDVYAYEVTIPGVRCLGGSAATSAGPTAPVTVASASLPAASPSETPAYPSTSGTLTSAPAVAQTPSNTLNILLVS